MEIKGRKSKNCLNRNIYAPNIEVLGGGEFFKSSTYSMTFSKNNWKSIERKRKIFVIFRDLIIDLEAENKTLKEENEELKRKLIK